jgi:hypothetical protein
MGRLAPLHVRGHDIVAGKAGGLIRLLHLFSCRRGGVLNCRQLLFSGLDEEAPHPDTRSNQGDAAQDLDFISFKIIEH